MDEKTLPERLAEHYSSKEISHFAKVIKNLSNKEFLDISKESKETFFNNCKEAEKLKANHRVYAFHTSDSYGGIPAEGIQLYVRYGNSLTEFYDRFCGRGETIPVEDLINYLKETNTKEIFTGPIKEKFLNLDEFHDEEDPIQYSILEDYDIDNFEKNGIKVHVLETLL